MNRRSISVDDINTLSCKQHQQDNNKSRKRKTTKTSIKKQEILETKAGRQQCSGTDLREVMERCQTATKNQQRL